MAPRSLPTRNSGFTAVEIMVVVAIVAVLAAIAAPNMSAMIRTQRVKTAAFDIYASLNLARSEAIKRNNAVTVTPNGGGWASGWSIADANGNVLKSQDGWTALGVTGPAAVSFNGTGRLAAAVVPFAVTADDIEVASQRCIRVDLSGRAVSKEGAC